MRRYILSMALVVLLLMPAVLALGNVKINDFSANVTNGTIPLHTRFTGDVTGNITSWRWIFENIGTGATTYSGSNITTHHNFGKLGIYNVTLNVWGPDGNDTLTKPAYITATSISTETKAKKKTTESTETNKISKNEATKSVSLSLNPNWGSKDKQHYLNGNLEGHTVGVINGYNHGYYPGIKDLKYTGTDHINFAPKSTTSQDIEYDEYNDGYYMQFLPGYDAGYYIL